MALLSIFRGTQAECSARPVSDGTLLFATDTKKIYLDKDSSRIEMSSVDDLGNYVTKEQLTTALNGKANTTHTHTQDQITGLKDALAGKASTSHSHSVASGSASGFMSAADKQKLDGIATGANKYTLPVASSTALGGVKIGYKESGKNYSVKLDNNNQAYVTVPWTDTTSKDTNTTYTLTKNGSTITLEGSDGSSTAVHDDNTTYSLGSFGITATATELNYVDGVTSNVQTQLNKKQDKMKTVTIPSSGNTHKNKWIKFATIDMSSAPAWETCAGTLSFCNSENTTSARGFLKFELRNGNTAGTIQSNFNLLVWVSLSSSSYIASVADVKVSNGKYDIYYKPVSDYEAVYVSLIDCTNTNYFTFNIGSWVDSITAATTSYVNSYADSAGSVPWSGVSSKPSTYPPSSHTHDDRYYTESEVDSKLSGKANSSHTHTKSQITDFPSSLKNPNSLTISLNGTSQGAYDGSAAKSINVTPASIGAAASSHNHSAANITSGTLSTDRLPTVPIGRGGTGAGSAADARANLGFNASNLTSEDLNALIGSTETKSYYGGGSNTVKNKPDGVDAFSLTVLRSADGWTSQVLVSSDQNPGIYYRSISGSTVQPWKRIYDYNSPLPVANGGTGATNAAQARANIGAAASSHNHDASNITSGTLSADRIPTITDGKIQSVSASKITGTIPQSILPSYVDDVLEYTNLAAFPKTGESGKIYVADDTNKTYRWSGTAYVEISASLALGTTSSTAFRGDYGNTAYAHAQAKGSAFSSGLYKITTNSQGHVTAATAVTKSDITALGIPGSDTNTNTTYSLSKSGSTITLKGSDGSTTSVTDADTNTTYSTFKGATTSAAGGTGLVPAPATGAANRYLRSDGTWQVPPDNNTTYSNMGGASSSAAGHAGLVPAPAAGASNRYLRSDGTWSVPPDNNTNTTYSLSKNGSTITLTGSDGSKTSVTDSNTTYSLSSFGINASAVELNYVKGVTSSIQTQLNSKAASSHNHSAANITSGTLSIARGGTGATDTATARSNLGFGFTQLYYNYDQGWIIYASDYMVWIYSLGVAIGSGSWDTKVCPYILPQKYRIGKIISHITVPCVVDNGGSWTGALVVNSDGQIIVKNLGNAGSTDTRYGFLCYPVGVL